MEVIVDRTAGKHRAVFLRQFPCAMVFELSLFCVRDNRVTLVRCSVNARKSLCDKSANPLKIWSFAFIEQQ